MTLGQSEFAYDMEDVSTSHVSGDATPPGRRLIASQPKHLSPMILEAVQVGGYRRV